MDVLKSHPGMRLACDRENLIGPLFSPRFQIPGRAPIFWLVRDKIGDHFLFRGSVNTFTLFFWNLVRRRDCYIVHGIQLPVAVERTMIMSLALRPRILPQP